MRCPTCNREIGVLPPEERELYRPFCSERCKMIDLGRWIGEDYRVPGVDQPSYENGAEGLED
jgi:endogenous inhibitor of DNA gyrase (YacG/DUF329 family)